MHLQSHWVQGKPPWFQDLSFVYDSSQWRWLRTMNVLTPSLVTKSSVWIWRWDLLCCKPQFYTNLFNSFLRGDNKTTHKDFISMKVIEFIVGVFLPVIMSFFFQMLQLFFIRHSLLVNSYCLDVCDFKVSLDALLRRVEWGEKKQRRYLWRLSWNQFQGWFSRFILCY